ncbi:MAG: hypothetical protein IPF96_03850 [Rhodobacter sp.]|nr:hypothetical protein [Rhodobacter sp.]
MGQIQSLEDLLNFLTRRRWLIMAVAALGIVLAAIYAKSRPDSYEAAAVIEVQSAQVGDAGTSGSAQLLQSIEQRLTSRENLAAVIDRHGLLATCLPFPWTNASPSCAEMSPSRPSRRPATRPMRRRRRSRPSSSRPATAMLPWLRGSPMISHKACWTCRPRASWSRRATAWPSTARRRPACQPRSPRSRSRWQPTRTPTARPFRPWPRPGAKRWSASKPRCGRWIRRWSPFWKSSANCPQGAIFARPSSGGCKRSTPGSPC